MALLDLRQFTQELAVRRNKAALLLTPDLPEQQAFAAQLAAATGARHLDVLDRFKADAALTARLTSFSVTDFLALIAEEKAQPFIIVSGAEFLLAAWLCQSDPKEVKSNFCQQIELWDQKPAFLLVAQYDSVFASYRPQRYKSSQVIIELSQTLSLS